MIWTAASLFFSSNSSTMTAFVSGKNLKIWENVMHDKFGRLPSQKAALYLLHLSFYDFKVCIPIEKFNAPGLILSSLLFLVKFSFCRNASAVFQIYSVWTRLKARLLDKRNKKSMPPKKHWIENNFFEKGICLMCSFWCISGKDNHNKLFKIDVTFLTPIKVWQHYFFAKQTAS